MDKSSALLPSAIIALGIVVLGFTVRSGIVTFKDRDRIVSVKGLSEREVKADKVIWPLVYKDLGNDPAEMYRQLEKKNQKIVTFLKSGGLTDSEISVNPPTIVDRQADNYGNEIMNFRYKATSVITVTSPNVDKVRALMNRQAELMKQDIAIVGEEYGGSNSPSYEFTGLNKIKPEMVEEATKNARITAEKFASDSGSELGDIRSASQGQFSIESRDASTPFMKKVRVVTTLEYTLK
ncbi:MAG: SIMPL domain-containing protein [Bacteroidaceae bacterium]|nr:SIMPL domain-containing protein [Bacteroidaceae bacterium]